MDDIEVKKKPDFSSNQPLVRADGWVIHKRKEDLLLLKDE